MKLLHFTTVLPSMIVVLKRETTASRSSRKHLLTLISIAYNIFLERLDSILESTLSPAPLKFSLPQSTLPITDSNEFEPVDLKDPLQIAMPLSRKYTLP